MARQRWQGPWLVLIGLVAGTLLVGTAGAHIGTPNHLWRNHIKPKVKRLTYTKTQANNRFQRACADGAVLAYAWVDSSDLGTSFGTSGIDGSSCTGTLLAREVVGPNPGLSEVDFGVRVSDGLACPGLVASGNPAPAAPDVTSAYMTINTFKVAASGPTDRCVVRVQTWNDVGLVEALDFTLTLVGSASP